MLTAAGPPVGQAGVDAVPGTHQRLLGNQVRGREAELATALVAVDHLAAQLEGRAEEVRGLIDLAGQHQAAYVAGGDDLAVDLEQRVHDRLEAPVGCQELGIALRAMPEAEVLPHRHPRGAERADEHLVDELARAAGREVGVEGDHDQLLTPSAAISSAFTARLVSNLGACWGATTDTGCGSNVSTLSAPRITSRWPRCTPSNVPTATLRPLPGLDVGQANDLHGPEA